MMMNEDPIVACERCKGPDGRVYRGWQLLCQDCAASDDEWFYDRGGK